MVRYPVSCTIKQCFCQLLNVTCTDLQHRGPATVIMRSHYWFWSLVALVVLLSGSVLASGSPAKPARTCLDFPAGTTVLFVADPGTFSNTPEAAFYLSNLKNKKQLPAGSAACPSIHVGQIMRQQAAVITTGIGPIAASLCVYDVLARCGTYIKDVFYAGTSGWSPQLGGVITNGTCEDGTANDNAQMTRLGDVCVSPFSVNWDCRQASHLQTATGTPNQCNFPSQDSGPWDDSLFGQCQFSNVTAGELSLANEVLSAAAAKTNNLPRRNDIIQGLETRYWAEMAKGTRINYSAIPQTAGPRIWTYRECMEIDSQFFYSGAPWEMVARAYIADTLNKGMPGAGASMGNVLAVSAMEGIGLSMAIERYNSLATTRRRIPYTYVRGMSNWLHSPLTYDGKIWRQGDVIQNFQEGYKYAIATSASVVLSTLQARCENQKASTAAAGTTHYNPRPPSAAPCTFTLEYN